MPLRLFAKLVRPLHKSMQQFAYQLFGCLIVQISLGIELQVSLRNHDFRKVQGVHVEKYEALTEMILGARASEETVSGADDRNRLAFPCTVAERAAMPSRLHS